MTESPRIPYWHLHVDAEGMSRQVLCHMTEFEMKAIQPQADPQWQGRPDQGGMTVLFTVLPVGWTGAWHENPSPQWIVPLSGRWFVEAMDGTRREFGPGEISFGEDQGCVPRDGRTGHLSGTVGDDPCMLMLVQLEARRPQATPCRFA